MKLTVVMKSGAVMSWPVSRVWMVRNPVTQEQTGMRWEGVPGAARVMYLDFEAVAAVMREGDGTAADKDVDVMGHRGPGDLALDPEEDDDADPVRRDGSDDGMSGVRSGGRSDDSTYAHERHTAMGVPGTGCPICTQPRSGPAVGQRVDG